MRRVMVAVAMVGVLAGCDQGDPEATGPTTAEPAVTSAAATPSPADTDLCTLLTPDDFAELADLTVSDPAEYSYYDSPVDAYCVYGPEDGAPEVDVFVVSPADNAPDVYQTVLDAGPVDVEAEGVVPGTDQSMYGRIESIDGVGVALRRGGLVAALSVPSDVPDAQAKLVALAQRLLERAGDLGG